MFFYKWDPASFIYSCNSVIIIVYHYEYINALFACSLVSRELTLNARRVGIYASLCVSNVCDCEISVTVRHKSQKQEVYSFA